MKTKKSAMVPKHCGGDYELGNFLEGEPSGHGAALRAAQLLMSEIKAAATVPSTYGRQFFSNGGCAYIDCDHLEMPCPEARSALDHCAIFRAMFGIAREAMDRVNARLPEGQRLRVLLNNSDGKGNSYGTHLNLLVSRKAFQSIMCGKEPHLSFLASYQAVTVPLFGQGKVGSEDKRPPVNYQLSQRADFYHELLSYNTMHPHRPLVNTRDESHCADDSIHARLHVIAYDNSLAQTTSVLKVGLLQIALAMIESGVMPADLLLAEPVKAVVEFSHDPTLRTTAARLQGKPITAAEWFEAFVMAAQRFSEDGCLEGIVPDWKLILELAGDTASLLQKRDYAALARRLDSYLKLAMLEGAMKSHGLNWNSPQIKMLDHLYASLDDDGLFWHYENEGLVDKCVPDEAIARFRHSPPADTRASIRGKLLSIIPAEKLISVDWDRVAFNLPTGCQGERAFTFSMPNPTEFLQPDSPLARATTYQDLVHIVSPPAAAAA